MELVTVADYDMFACGESSRSKPSNGRSSRYKELKRMVEDRMLDVFCQTFPHLKERIHFVDSGTPMTNKFFLGAQHGEVYGLAHNCHRFSSQYDDILKPQQPIRGLYLSGQDVMCDGICGALAGGVFCAAAVDSKVFVDLATSYVVDYA